MNNHINFTVILMSLWLFAIIPASHALHNQNDATNVVKDDHSHPHFKLVGQGKMHWLWFELYQAKLFTPSGIYQPQQWPLVLELTYACTISREKLVKITEEEWQRQKINYQPQWLSQLADIWPNISPGDRLLLNVDKKGQSQFFYNGQLIGTLNDEKFTLAFTAIWFSENTLKPTLRNQLTGLQP